MGITQTMMLVTALALFVTTSQAFTPTTPMGLTTPMGAARHGSGQMLFGTKPKAAKAPAKKGLAALKKSQGSNKGSSTKYGDGISINLSKSGKSLQDLAAAKRSEDPDIIPGLGLGEASEKSIALPFVAYPSTLDGSMVGDVGFDPLGLAKTPELLEQYRLAELKHARLAMLAAVGFIVSEEQDFKFATQLGLPSMLTDTDGRALDVAFEVNPLFFLTTLIAGGFIELQGKNFASNIIGDVGFDPLKLFPENEVAQQRMRLAELKHGRIAMLAVLVFALDEEFLKVPVIDLIKERTGGLFPIPAEDVAGYNKFEGLVSMVSDVAQHLA